MIIPKKKNDVEFYKVHPSDKIVWASCPERGIAFYFSFDGKKWYNYYEDYPHNLTPKEKAIFDKENEVLSRRGNADNMTFDW